MSTPIATHAFTELPAALEFLKRTRWELRLLRRVHIYVDRIRIIDVNGDYFELHNVGYPDAPAVELLRGVNTAFDPLTLADPVDGEYKEFFTGRCVAWAADRLM